MTDDSAARRDAWRDAQTATTVTGDRTGGEPPREHEGEAIHLPDTLDLRDENKARAGLDAYRRARYGEGRSIEDALAVARDAGLVVTLPDGGDVVADLEAWEAENPDVVADVVARVKERFAEPTTDGATAEGDPLAELRDEVAQTTEEADDGAE